MAVIIRHETAADVADIAAVTAAAFLTAPHASQTEPFIVTALRNAAQLPVSLVAEDAGEIIGHVAVSPVSISDGATGWYGLGPISVTPRRQGQGIGSQLMRQALDELRRLDAAGCVVVGEPHYYGRFGFRAEPALVLPGVPPHYFQAIVFRDSLPSGVVSYHDAFDAQG